MDEAGQSVNKGLEDGRRQMWQGIDGVAKKSEAEGSTQVVVLRAVDGRPISSGNSLWQNSLF